MPSPAVQRLLDLRRNVRLENGPDDNMKLERECFSFASFAADNAMFSAVSVGDNIVAGFLYDGSRLLAAAAVADDPTAPCTTPV